MKWILLISCTLFFLQTNAQTESAEYWYKKGYEKYYEAKKNGLYSDESVEIFKKAMEYFLESVKHLPDWDARRSCYYIGEIYYYQRGVKKDYAKAKEWYEKAEKIQRAYFKLGEMYAKGKGVEMNKKRLLRIMIKESGGSGALVLIIMH